MNSIKSILLLLTLSYKLTKLREKWRQISISHYFFKIKYFLKVKTTISLINIKLYKKTRLNKLELLWKSNGSITYELWFELFGSLIKTWRRSNFFNKKDRLITIQFFWIVIVQEWSKASFATAICTLGTLNSSTAVDINVLFVKKSKKKCCVFDNRRVKLAKMAKF